MTSCEVKSGMTEDAARATPPAPGGLKIPHIRWWIAGLLCLAAINNYIDRNILGQLLPLIKADLHITDQQYAMVGNAFLVAYTIAYILSGRVVDWLGTRRSLALFVGWWSLSNALVGFAGSLYALASFRFMLGLGEAGCWTASPKAVSEWFPPRERGLAVGIYSMGGATGAVIAPVLVTFLAHRWGWQSAFVATGLLGLLWLVPWLWLYHKPQDHPRITEHERALLAEVIEDSRRQSARPREPELKLWGEILRQPVVWVLLIARLLTDPVWYFYSFWMPNYLNTARGFDTKSLMVMSLIFLAADLGFAGGGFLSGRLVKRGLTAPTSRLWMMLGSACLMPLLPLVGLASSNAVSIGVAMVVVMAATSWLGNLTSLVVDLIPKRILGTAFGLIAGGSALGGIFMNQMVGATVGKYSYQPCFWAMAFIHPVVLIMLWRLRRMRVVE